MKKNIKVLSIMIFAMSLLMGCQNKESLQDTAEASVEIRTDATNIEEVSIEKDKIKIKYPKLVNLEDKKIEDKWNQIIEDRITKDLELLSQTDVYDLTYEVASNTEEELSLKLIGSCYYDGAAEPFNFIYTYNIDLTTGESIRLSDQTDVVELAAKIYNNQGFTIETNVNEDFMQFIHSAFENEDLLAEMLSNFDYSEDAEQPYGYSFYEHGQLHLCIEVPHDVGDYVILVLENNDEK
jgi:hypothetical protein